MRNPGPPDAPTHPAAPPPPGAPASRDAAPDAAWFDRLVRATPSPSLVVDPTRDRIVAANPAARALYGLGPLPAAFSALHPGRLPRLIVFVEEAQHRGRAWTRDLPARHASGRPLTLEYEAAPLDAPSGAPHVLFLAADLEERARRDLESDADTMLRRGLTEWRRMERFFRQMDDLNNLILSSAGDGIYGVDADGLTTFANPAAERMLGWSEADVIGRDMHGLIHHKHPDGSLYPAHECPIYNAFRHAKVNRVDDEIFWRKDGRPLRVEYTSTPMIDGDDVLGAVVVFRDITERKESERRLREALAENDRLKQRLEMENEYLLEEIREHRNHHEIIGASRPIAEVLRQVDLVAPTGANVLITGESGTGKELVAQAIHMDSPRAARPMIRVNCAAIPRELFESEFFGHARGAFTGALRDRVGRFELADGGTLFLDEVGEIPLELQGKLLRVLQDQRFERVGEDRTRATDVRIIAATNRDLAAEVARGRFREDLFFRLDVFPIALPPLRDRREDVPLLAEHFLTRCCRRLNLAKPALTRAHVAELSAYDWPGNARELENVVERAAILSQRGKLRFDLPRAVPEGPAPAPGAAPVETEERVRARERANIEAALKAAGGRVSGPGGAAELLGLKPTTLYSRIRRHGLDRGR
ncbi:MAG: sigma 54-interacting transcriptional regulator [Pseudomonadota bacterium]|nr:sigma 54-interacting transcriptional regulator [Pseudomonadota bacterium]